MAVRWALALAPVPLIGAAAAAAECPISADAREVLSRYDLDSASRTARFGVATPWSLYERAVKKPGEPATRQNGKVGLGVLLIEAPIGDVWKAVNDEEHHSLDGHLPIECSRVIEGEARASSRVLFQCFHRWGIGRWWVTKAEINGELYRESDRTLWEVFWHDQLERFDAAELPVQEMVPNDPPLRESHGAWLLLELAERCTVLEYFTETDPGGALKLGQSLVGNRALRANLLGIATMAHHHIPESHPDEPFPRPDGTAGEAVVSSATHSRLP